MILCEINESKINKIRFPDGNPSFERVYILWQVQLYKKKRTYTNPLFYK